MGGAAGALGRVAGVAAFAAAGWFALAAELAPAPRDASGARAGPDLLFCVAAFWVVRRPRAAPAALVVALGLLRDALAGWPPGLGALALLAATELLRARGPWLRAASFALESAAVVVAAAAALALQWALLVAVLAAPPPAADLALRFGLTALAWPATVLLLRGALRLRSEVSPADGDPMFGRRA